MSIIWEFVYFHNAIFMYSMITLLLICQAFLIHFFIKFNQKHKYNTRLASKYSFFLPHIRTNYGKFNIRLTGAKA